VVSVVLNTQKILNVHLKSGQLNFFVFEFFESPAFLTYIRATLDVQFLLFRQMVHCPKLFELHVGNLLIIAEKYLEILIHGLPPEYVVRIVQNLKDCLRELSQNMNSRTDELVTSVALALQHICKFFIVEREVDERNRAATMFFLDLGSPALSETSDVLLEICFLFRKKTRVI